MSWMIGRVHPWLCPVELANQEAMTRPRPEYAGLNCRFQKVATDFWFAVQRMSRRGEEPPTRVTDFYPPVDDGPHGVCRAVIGRTVVLATMREATLRPYNPRISPSRLDDLADSGQVLPWVGQTYAASA